MKRPIKFRGKCITNGKWVYGTASSLSNGEALIFMPDTANCKKLFYEKVDPKTIGQFTGLKDREGNEIYEDDIVESPTIDPIFGDPIIDMFDTTVIEFHDGAFVINYNNGSRRIYLSDLVEYATIKGNVFDNPQLLEINK